LPGLPPILFFLGAGGGVGEDTTADPTDKLSALPPTQAQWQRKHESVHLLTHQQI